MKSTRHSIKATKTTMGKAGTRTSKSTTVALRTRKAQINRIEEATASTADMLNKCGTPLDFVLPCFLIGTVGQMVATGGVGKSFFALQNAISIAVGHDLFGFWGDGNTPFQMKQGRAIYISVEDGQDIVRKRLQDCCIGLTDTQRQAVTQNLELVFPSDFSILKRGGRTPEPSDWIEDLRAVLKKKRTKPRLIIIDTLNRSLAGVNENNSSGIGMIVQVLEGIAQPFQSSVLLLHHTAKGKGKGEAGLGQDAARGAGAGSASCRYQINMVLDEPRPEDVLGNPQPDKIAYVISKANYGERPPKRFVERQKNGVLIGFSKHAVKTRVTRTNVHAPANNLVDEPLQKGEVQSGHSSENLPVRLPR